MRRWVLAVAVGASALVGAGAARSQTPLTDADLEHQRAGFLSLAGFTFDFGVVARTEVDGKLALETSLTIGPDGLETVRTLGDASAFKAGGLAFSVASDGSVAVSDQSGVTTVQQTLTASQIRNTVLNTASGRDVRQATNLNLVLPDFVQTQQAIAASQLATRLTAAVQSGLAVGR